MAGKHNFTLRSEDKRRDLPRKIIIGQQPTETIAHVLLKLLGFVLFYRDRLQIEANLHMDSIPFVPDLVELDYELQPKLWIECGECSVNKLDRLAVKVPNAEIWVVKRSFAAVEELVRAMERGELRRDRYHLVGLDAEMFEEMCGLVTGRNELTWIHGSFDPPEMQFDFNGLWFDAPFQVTRF